MTTQKEFHELMIEMEESEKLASLGPWFIDGGHVSSHNDIICDYIAAYENREFITLSRTFIPFAIDRIKRLERAMEVSIKCLEEYKNDGFGEYGCGCCADQAGGKGATAALEQIKKELGE